MGLTKEEKREYQRAYMARKRSNKETNKEVGLTGEGLTKQGSNTKGLTRLNPANGLAYGPSMASLPERVLAEYERKWKQYEPVYGEGVPGENMACIAVGFGSIYQSLASKHLENEVRVGVYGPTVGQLYEATHP